MSQTMERVLVWCIRICAGIILCLPLLVTRQTMFPFVFGKMIVFQAFVEISFAAWVLLIVYFKKYRPSWHNPIVWSLSAYMIVLVITMMAGIDPGRSFWSTQERMTGVFSFLHFWVWTLIISSTFHTWKEWRALLFLTLAVNAIVNVIGIAYPQAETKNIVSTLGNSIYVGVYAMLHSFLASFFFCLERKRLVRAMLFLSIAFNLLMIAIAGSRTVFLSFLGLAILLGIILHFIVQSFLQKKHALWSIGFFILLLVLTVSGWWLRTEEGSVWGRDWLPRSISRVLYTQGADSTADHFTLWKIGFQGFLDRPLFGWGPENYKALYEKHLIPRPYMVTYYDRSHSQIVDVLALGGIIGVFGYALFWGSIFFVLFKSMRRNTDRIFRIVISILAAFFLSYFLQGFTVFDSPAPLFLFFFILSFLIFLFERNVQSRDDGAGGATFLFTPPALLVPPIAMALFLLVYFFNIVPFLSSARGVQGMTILQKDPQEAFRILEQSLSSPSFTNAEILTNTVSASAPLILVYNTLDSAVPSSIKIRVVDFLIRELERELDKRPNANEINVYLSLDSVLLQGYLLTFADRYLTRAEQILAIAQELSPRRGEVYLSLAQLALLRYQGAPAVQYGRRASDLASSASRSASAQILIQALFMNGEVKEGLEMMRKTERGDSTILSSSNIAISIARGVKPLHTEELQYALEYIDNAIRELPDNVTLEASRVLIYQKAGKVKEAEMLLSKLEKKNPQVVRELLKLQKKTE